MWGTKKIGDICSIKRGASPRPIQQFLDKEGIPWVKIADATSSYSRYIETTNQFIKPEGADKSVTVSPGTLILSNSATPGLPKIMKIKACVHDGWLILSDFRDVTRDFLYYMLLNIRKTIINQANGSVFQNLKTDIVRNFDILLPPIEYQQKLVKFLVDIDEKIYVNRQINTNLEQQAQAIFKSWFIDFEPFGGTMPDDWQKACLLDIADYTNGLAMQKYRPTSHEQGIFVMKIKELRQGFCDSSSELCSNTVNPFYLIHNGDVIFSWSGSLLVDFWCGGLCGLNQHLFKVTSNKYAKWFYYCWTKFHLHHFITEAADKATTMGHIKRENLAKAEVVIPTKQVYLTVGDLLGQIYNLMIANRIEINALSTLRDTLLPKLTSGEIDVSKIELG